MEDINEINFEIEDDELQKNKSKSENIEKEKIELLNRVLSGNINSTKERVGYLLNNFPETRNSDIDLAWLYWTTFENKLFDGQVITKSQLNKLTKIYTLSRTRAKIQNEYMLFQADDIVKKHRGKLELEKRNQALDDKPTNLPVYSVYIDETGKTGQFLSVGSLWIIDGGYSAFKTSQILSEWKKHNNIDFEFHFTKLNKNRVQIYKDFFLKFLSLNPTIGFKIIIINKEGLKDITKAITDLTFHLIDKGISHENISGRAPLPRTLQVWIDEEEKGSDKLKLENLKERIKGQQIDGLILKNFEAISSKENHYIQAVDLFTSAVNRKLHPQDKDGHFKDDLADFILNLLKFDINKINQMNLDIDKSAVFNLTYEKQN